MPLLMSITTELFPDRIKFESGLSYFNFIMNISAVYLLLGRKIFCPLQLTKALQVPLPADRVYRNVNSKNGYFRNPTDCVLFLLQIQGP